ncbi:MAG: amidohydrolase family protein [Candidatus Dormiibacterota bacterium]|jgi:aminocarboxymuconate-semialdehyde decarboxylase
MTEEVPMVIDVHAHHYPKQYLERIGRPGLPPAAAAALAYQDIGQRLELLDRVGIDTQVLSVSQAQPYLPAAADAADAARLINDLYADVCRDHPGRFYAFAALPLPHVDESLEEIARTLDTRWMVGVTIGCSVSERQLDDPIFEPVFQELDRRQTPVFLHPVGQEETSWLAGSNLPWLVGAPFEDTAAALRLVLGGVIDRHPGIRFIVPHLGGTIPFLLARVTRKSDDRVRSGLARLYYDTVSGSTDAVVCSCHAFGADRLLFGTDYPYCDEAEFEHHLTYLDDCGLEPAALQGVRGGAAANLLHLDRGAPSPG